MPWRLNFEVTGENVEEIAARALAHVESFIPAPTKYDLEITSWSYDVSPLAHLATGRIVTWRADVIVEIT